MRRRLVRLGLTMTASLAAIVTMVGYATAGPPSRPAVDPARAAEARQVSAAEPFGDASYGPGFRSDLQPRVTAAVTGTPAQVGQWRVLAQTTPGLAIHAAALPGTDVRFLLIKGSGNNGTTFAAGTFETYVWNVTKSTMKTITTPDDVFCAGHVFLANGELLVVGGTASFPTSTHGFLGTKTVYAFDPRTETYRQLPSTSQGHWYPTVVTDGLGRPNVVSGLNESGGYAQQVERYYPSTNTWQLLPYQRSFPSYPGLILTAKGQLFYTGTNVFGGHTVQSGFWTVFNNVYTPAYGLPNANSRNQGASVMLYPAQKQRVMTAGGGGPYNTTTTASTALIDLATPGAAWRAGPPLAHAKMHVTLVNLPTGGLLQTNGGAKSNSEPVLDAQTYSPYYNRWTTVASPTVPRLYHGVALLGADGQVYTLGSNPAGAAPETRIEVYSPPYVFQPYRPTLSFPRSNLRYGGLYGATASARYGWSRFVMIRPSAATHSSDPDQRSIDVPFRVVSSTSVQLRMPATANLAPPGWYMIFGVDKRGVPGKAAWVQIT